MKHLFAAALAASATLAGVANAADVGVSVQISQPGIYGRIDIGRFPQPTVIAAQPVLVAPKAVLTSAPEPVYMWVPPGHRKNWRKHCAHYKACGTPVYFVRDDWYEQHVRPHGHGAGHPGKGKGKKD